MFLLAGSQLCYRASPAMEAGYVRRRYALAFSWRVELWNRRLGYWDQCHYGRAYVSLCAMECVYYSECHPLSARRLAMAHGGGVCHGATGGGLGILGLPHDHGKRNVPPGKLRRILGTLFFGRDCMALQRIVTGTLAQCPITDEPLTGPGRIHDYFAPYGFL